jgi:hypothetical protein
MRAAQNLSYKLRSQGAEEIRGTNEAIQSTISMISVF